MTGNGIYSYRLQLSKLKPGAGISRAVSKYIFNYCFNSLLKSKRNDFANDKQELLILYE